MYNENDNNRNYPDSEHDNGMSGDKNENINSASETFESNTQSDKFSGEQENQMNQASDSSSSYSGLKRKSKLTTEF